MGERALKLWGMPKLSAPTAVSMVTLWHADGAVGVGLRENDAFGGELVDVRRHHGVAAAGPAQTIPAPLVCGDDDDVGPVGIGIPLAVTYPLMPERVTPRMK